MGTYVDTAEDGLIPEENVATKVKITRESIGETISVDDLGSETDHSNKELGTHLVCHTGEDILHYTKNVSSTERSNGALDEKCIVRPARVAVVVPLDGSAKIACGITEGCTGHEEKGENGPGHDLTPHSLEHGRILVESLGKEKNKTSYRGKVPCVTKDESKRRHRLLVTSTDRTRTRKR